MCVTTPGLLAAVGQNVPGFVGLVSSSFRLRLSCPFGSQRVLLVRELFWGGLGWTISSLGESCAEGIGVPTRVSLGITFGRQLAYVADLAVCVHCWPSCLGLGSHKMFKT